MPGELARPLAFVLPARFFKCRKSRPPLLIFLFILLYLASSTTCVAQTLINGQTFTNGLAIIDAPAPESQQHVGSTIPIAIELSGNGKLPFIAFAPGSGLASCYELLEIYLVSSQTGLNLTMSSGTGLLTGESGTVRHLSPVLPSCVPAGEYNLTFYETSHINSILSFVITPIPISVANEGESSPSCAEGVNQLQVQPQPDADFGQSPFNPNSHAVVVSTGNIVSDATPTQMPVSVSDVGTTSIATGPTTFVESPTPTNTSFSPSGSVTLVIVAPVVITTTNSLNKPITTSYMTTRTTTVPMSTAVSDGVIPINAGTARLDRHSCVFIPLLITLLTMNHLLSLA